MKNTKKYENMYTFSTFSDKLAYSLGAPLKAVWPACSVKNLNFAIFLDTVKVIRETLYEMLTLTEFYPITIFY